ncbi:MAG: zinc-ribbon domain containing protein [Desulfobacteraceae bacterium]|nr:zinc-ribbon domain containing protein [Desulfobacteraceae bacterium]
MPEDNIDKRSVIRDRVITCIQCENTFLLTVAGQERLLAKGFDLPKRCSECRKKKGKKLVFNGKSKDTEKKIRRRRRIEKRENGEELLTTQNLKF